MDLSLSTSVLAGFSAMSSLFEVLGMSAAASLPVMCFLGEDPAVLFITASFVSVAVAFFVWVFLPIVSLPLIATSSKDFILTGVTDVLLEAEEDDDGCSAPRRRQ